MQEALHLSAVLSFLRSGTDHHHHQGPEAEPSSDDDYGYVHLFSATGSPLTSPEVVRPRKRQRAGRDVSLSPSSWPASPTSKRMRRTKSEEDLLDLLLASPPGEVVRSSINHSLFRDTKSEDLVTGVAQSNATPTPEHDDDDHHPGQVTQRGCQRASYGPRRGEESSDTTSSASVAPGQQFNVRRTPRSCAHHAHLPSLPQSHYWPLASAAAAFLPCAHHAPWTAQAAQPANAEDHHQRLHRRTRKNHGPSPSSAWDNHHQHHDLPAYIAYVPTLSPPLPPSRSSAGEWSPATSPPSTSSPASLSPGLGLGRWEAASDLVFSLDPRPYRPPSCTTHHHLDHHHGQHRHH
jgi:hypothetical protein